MKTGLARLSAESKKTCTVMAACLALGALCTAAEVCAASRVFFDDFEEGTAAQWSTQDIHPKAVVVNAAHDMRYGAHGGTRMLEWNWQGSPQNFSGVALDSWDFNREMFIRYWFREDADVDHVVGSKMMRLNWQSPDNSYWACQNEAGDTANLYMYWTTDSWNQAYWGSSQDTCGDHRWHEVEIYIRQDTDNTDGIIRVWWDGNQVFEKSNTNTHSNGGSWGPLAFPSNWSNAVYDNLNHAYLDDVEIYSDSTSGQGPVTGTMSGGDIAVDGHSVPIVTGVAGEVSHGAVLSVSGSGFGAKSPAAPFFYDSVDNQPAYSSLHDNDRVPVGDGYPWPTDDSYSGVGYSTSRPQRHSGSKAMYSTFPSLKGNLQAGSHGRETNTDTFYLSWWMKPSHDFSLDSFKILRLSDGSPWPCIYEHAWSHMQHVFYDAPNATYVMQAWADYIGDGRVGQWNRNEVIIARNPADQQAGYLASINEKVNASWSGSLRTAVDNLDVIGFDPNIAEDIPSGFVMDFDEIYIDNTRARIEICDAPAWADKGHCEIQIPSAWGDNAITLTTNQGSFNNGDTAYVYIVNSGGAVNASGYPVTIGSGGGDTTAPGEPAGLAVRLK